MNCTFKIIFKDSPGKVLVKGNLSTYKDYDSLKAKLLEKTKGQLTPKDKFILEIEGLQLSDLNSIWDSETYNYILSRIEQYKIDKIKLSVVKVDKYPIWNPPQFTKLLKNSLTSAWDSTRKEIENELTEKYLTNGKRKFMQEKLENDPKLEDVLYKGLHVDIICNNCLTSNFGGARFICCECDNYNLCEYCKKNTKISHNPEHTFIKMNSPVLVDIQKYNSIFSPHTQLMKVKQEEPFEVKIKIINNGETDLQGCFISPIRFGDKYLGCLKKTIVQNCQRGNQTNMDVLITFDYENPNSDLLENYEGYYRLMTKEGIPFGDIFYIKVKIEE